MSKKFVPILALSILALAWPAIAETGPCAPSQADAGLPGIVAELEGGAVDLAPAEAPGVSEKACSAFAYCHDGTTRTCSTSSSASCTGVNSNCSSGQRGYARCGSSYYYCPPCPPTVVCSAQYYCADINDGLHGSVCPSQCIIDSPSEPCGFCSPGPGSQPCLCTE